MTAQRLHGDVSGANSARRRAATALGDQEIVCGRRSDRILAFGRPAEAAAISALLRSYGRETRPNAMLGIAQQAQNSRLVSVTTTMNLCDSAAGTSP